MPDLWMDVDAALAEVPVNMFPLTDDTDFKTRETAIAYDAGGMDLVWNFVTTAGAYTQTAVTPTTGGDYDWAHQGDGMYSIEIPASGGASINNDTEGVGWFSGVCTGVLPWRGPFIGFRAAGLNNLLIDDAFSATRGLAGTAVPAAAAGAAGGIPTDSTGKTSFNDLSAAQVNTEVDTALNTAIPGSPTAHSINERVKTMDDADMPTSLTTLLGRITSTLFSGITSLAEWLGLIAGKQTGNATARTELRATGAGSGTYDETADSQEAIRDRGDAAWTTGGGASLTEILNLHIILPTSIDLANTATYTLGVMLTNALDDLPSAAEITPGTITIERKAIGATTWTTIVNAAACSERAGMIFYDEVFDTGSGYAEGDSIKITFQSAKITVDANDYEIFDATGVSFYTEIRQTMRGTNSAALAAVCTEARLGELDATNLPQDVQDARTDIANLNNLSAAQVNAEADAALVDIHLDHLLAVEYDPASKPGVATALFNELIENDGGVSRFTENALEQAPSGSSATIYFETGDSNQDEDGDLEWMAYGIKNGVIQTGATSCVVQLVSIDGDGTITNVTGATETVAAPDANGVFNGTLSALTLDPGQMYYMLVTMTIDSSSRIGLFSVKVPVRTA